jgi:DnaJ family protein B protein 4
MSDPITVKTLDGRTLSVAVDEIISPKTTKKVAGEGMPRRGGKSAGNGDLIIRFDIKFPTTIESHELAALKKILS